MFNLLTKCIIFILYLFISKWLYNCNLIFLLLYFLNTSCINENLLIRQLNNNEYKQIKKNKIKL